MHAVAVEVEAGRVQQHVPARHQDEAQQRLDDVRVEHVRRAHQHRAGDDADAVAPCRRGSPSRVGRGAPRRRPPAVATYCVTGAAARTSPVANHPASITMSASTRIGRPRCGRASSSLSEVDRGRDAHDAVDVVAVTASAAPAGGIRRRRVRAQVDDEVDRARSGAASGLRCASRAAGREWTSGVRQGRSWSLSDGTDSGRKHESDDEGGDERDGVRPQVVDVEAVASQCRSGQAQRAEHRC